MSIISLFIVALLGFILLILGFLALAALIKGLRGSPRGSHQNRTLEAEETRMIQELHQGLERMEKRIEAIETLLMDRDRDLKGS